MAVEEFAVKAVADELRRASDIGEARSRAALRETCGLGAGDLEATLAVLIESGAVSEAEPDQYRFVAEEDRQGDEDDPDGDEIPEEERTPSRTEPPRRPRRPPAEGAESRVTLTQGVAEALDAQSLGALVKAGIEEAKAESVAFIFEVTP